MSKYIVPLVILNLRFLLFTVCTNPMDPNFQERILGCWLYKESKKLAIYTYI